MWQEINLGSFQGSNFPLYWTLPLIWGGAPQCPRLGWGKGGGSILSGLSPHWHPPTLLVLSGLQPSGPMGHCWPSSPQPHSHSRFLGFSEPRADSCRLHVTHSALRGPSPYTWTFHRRVFCSHARTLEIATFLSLGKDPHVGHLSGSSVTPQACLWTQPGGWAGGPGCGEECSLGALTGSHSAASQALHLPAHPEASWVQGWGLTDCIWLRVL